MKKLYYKVRLIEDKVGCIYPSEELGERIKEWIDAMNEGGELVVKGVMMAEREFEKLNEYEG